VAGDVLTATNMNDLGGTVNLVSPTAKGSIKAGTAAATFGDLAVGANDTVLTADSAEATGMKWAAAAAGGMTLLSTTTLSGTSVTISSISQDYKHLYITFDNLSGGFSGQLWQVKFQNASYRRLFTNITASTVTQAQRTGTGIEIASGTSSSGVYGFAYLYNYSDSLLKNFILNSRSETQGGSDSAVTLMGTTTDTTPVDNIVVDENGTTMTGGTVRIYGVP
jgi:hypothetical protein